MNPNARNLQDKIEIHRKEISRLKTLSAHNVRPAEIADHQSEILVICFQLAEISTRRIVHLTWFLAFLTSGLLAVGLIQVVIMFKH